MAQTKIRAIGNSKGVLIPSEVLDRLGLDEGDDLIVATDADRIVLMPADGDRRRRIFVEAMDQIAKEDYRILAELAKV